MRWSTRLAAAFVRCSCAVIVLVMCGTMISGQNIDISNNPCPEYIVYQNENEKLVAYLKIVFPRRNENKLEVEFQYISPIENHGTLTMLDDEATAIDKVKTGKQIFFKLNFPPWDVQPKITKIFINANLVCSGPGVEAFPGETQRTVKQASTFSIQGLHFDGADTQNQYQPPTNYRPVAQPTRRPPPQITTTTYRPTTSYTPPQRRPPPAPSTTSRPYLGGGNSNSLDQICGTSREVNTLTIGGKVVPKGRYPWIAPMYVRHKRTGWEYRCVGNLVSDKHLLTAGHCTENNGVLLESRNVLFALGLYNIDRFSVEKDAKNVIVREIFTHKSYEIGNGDGDIAVIVLEERIQFNNFIRPVCLWPDNFGNAIENLSDINVLGVVAGWGLDESNEVSSIPKEVSLPVVAQTECWNSHETFRSVTSNRTFCAGERDGVGPCNGDSGSGFVVSDGKKSYIRGLVSISLKLRESVVKCDLHNYIIFADVAKFMPWIRDIMNTA